MSDEDRKSLPIEFQDAANSLSYLDGAGLDDDQRDELARVIVFEVVRLAGLESVSVAVRWFERQAQENESFQSIMN